MEDKKSFNRDDIDDAHCYIVQYPPSCFLNTFAIAPDRKAKSGLQIFDITTPPSGPEVTVSSTVTMHDTLGTTGARNAWRIASSHEHDPLTFTIGRGSVIRGLEEGVVGMRAGGLRRLLIPPELGYHSNKDHPIPTGFSEYQRFLRTFTLTRTEFIVLMLLLTLLCSGLNKRI